jgi:cubilin
MFVFELTAEQCADIRPVCLDLTDVNECAAGSTVCHPLSVCQNRPGSFACLGCPTGYTGTGVGASGCIGVSGCFFDLVSCSLSRARAGSLQTSTNAQRATVAVTRTAHAATLLAAALVDSVLRDSKALATPTAQVHSACNISKPSFPQASCSIADVNECLSNNGGCDARQVCTNTVGSRSCGACSSGFRQDGATRCVGQRLLAYRFDVSSASCVCRYR